MGSIDFWANVRDFLKTAAEIKDADILVMNAQTYFKDEEQGDRFNDAFYPGSGGESLDEALIEAGWRIRYIEGNYRWMGIPPEGDYDLEYIEGDMYLRQR